MSDKALLTGINNYSAIGDLRGCINDTKSMFALLTEEFGFKESAICVLNDDDVNKAKLRKQWKWLLKGTKPGDRLVFHFSGHGSYTVDQDGDEDEGVDELICLHTMDWNDPDSYLLDDELRAWTQEIPTGVHLTVLLDSCHSGTGTRMIAPPASKLMRGKALVSPTLVDIESSLRRMSKANGSRAAAPKGLADVALALRDVLPESMEMLGTQSVVARFAPPPPEVLARLNQVGKRSSFSLAAPSAKGRGRSRATESAMNHVLWSGSQSDQTSADAFIDGDYHGAFTWNFCSVLRSVGTKATPASVISELRAKLKRDGFSQVPQLEPNTASGPIFGEPKTIAEDSDQGTENDQIETPEDGDLPIKPTAYPTAEQWERIATSLETIAARLSSDFRDSSSSPTPSIRQRALVYVHGICLHEAGYSDPWWKSLSPHLSSALRTQLEHNRPEVLWSKHVTQTDRALAPTINVEEQRSLEQQLREVLQERATQEVAAAIANTNEQANRGDRAEAPVISRAAFGIPGLDCVDDFTKYLVSDPIRAAVIAEFTKVVQPRLARGETIDVISHSWGTVVAYAALRALEVSSYPGRVATFFTVGAALAISFIKNRLRPTDGRRPRLVDRWVNIDAKGDIVGGSLRAVGLAVDAEFLNLEPTGCTPFGGFLQLYQPACSHSSYFKSNNTVVNRDIFAKSIDK